MNLPSQLGTSSLSPEDALGKVMKATQRALEHLDNARDLAQVEAWSAHVLESRGRVILCGMGKSGIVAQKISATLASTGCPSFFLHPAEALHGDLGMVTGEDTLLILSNSGEAQEIVSLLPSLLRMGIKIAAITSKPDSRLALAATWCFGYSLPEGEGCPLDFAPMASTTIQMVWGDMLAANLMVRSGFTLEKFAQFHPAGNLGSRLMKTNELMHHKFPVVDEATRLLDVLAAMTKGTLGMATVLRDGRLQGVISDGDVRRAVGRLEETGANPLALMARDVMTWNPITIPAGMLAIEAARIMESRKITFLVVQEDGIPQGVLHIHDLLAAKVI